MTVLCVVLTKPEVPTSGNLAFMSGSGPAQSRRGVRSVRPEPGFVADTARWPACVPAVGQVLREGLKIPAGLTIVVGENGAGKSTLIELIAEACGLNPQGGSVHTRNVGRISEPGLGRYLIVERDPARSRWSYFLRADTTHGLYTYLEENPGRSAEPSFHELSHGEGFLALLQTKVNKAGFYLMDEPDAPLSFTSTLALISVLGDLLKEGSQIMLAAHSPMVAATPGATILELGDWGIRQSEWDDLLLVGYWRSFLANPAVYLRPLLEDV